MEDDITTITTVDPALELGIALGERRTFGMLAGRCSAAHAECLRKIRDEKLYLKYAEDWDSYCEQYLKISRRTANRLIGHLKDGGPLYFEVAALTGISFAQFQRIAKSVQPDGIHVSGEVIALIPANTTRAIEAVAQLQAEADAQAAAEEPPTFQTKLRDLEKKGAQLAKAYRQLRSSANEIERPWLNGSVRKVGNEIACIEIGG